MYHEYTAFAEILAVLISCEVFKPAERLVQRSVIFKDFVKE